jgi:hypothetical protein
MTDTQTLIAAVKAHALANYEKGGWDFIVECWDDADILEEIGECKTAKQAIRAVGAVAKALAGQREEVRGEW